MRVSRRHVVLSAAALAGCQTTGAAASDPLAGLSPTRPRLLTTPAEVATLETRLASHAAGQRWRVALLGEADRLLTLPPQPYTLEPRRPVLLPTSREILRRVEALGTAWLLTRKAEYAERLGREIDNAAGFESWNPSHFLDVGEMAAAVALALDWCHDGLPPAVREKAEVALIENALRPAVEGFERRAFWTRVTHNWALVCAGGITLAALAVAERAPALARDLLPKCIETARRAFASYGPDGAWDEGGSYWDYATQYAVMLAAGLTTALGQDFGLTDAPGFQQTALFRLHIEGPAGRAFNFGDGGEAIRHTPALMWLARRFNQPVAAWIAARQPASHGLGLIWFQAPGPGPAAEPLDQRFRHAEVAMLRGRWDDRAAPFIAFKAGDNAANHSHLDLGAFVLDAGGERFGVDLGPDDYALPGFFDPRRRYSYYRTGTAGQNTLLVAGENQPPAAKTRITGFRSTPNFAAALADLSPAYPRLRRMARAIALVDRRVIVIGDEWDGDAPVRWTMHTRADITVDGTRAVLTQGGVRLNARLVGPPGAVFTVESAAQSPPENPNTGIRRLVIHLGTPGPVRLVVGFALEVMADAPLVAVDRPLAAWTGG